MTVVIWVYLYLVLQMSLVWVIYRFTKNPSVVDVSWSMGFIAAGLFYLLSRPVSFGQSLVLLLLSIWGLRLAAHILLRIVNGEVDLRYQKLSDQWKMSKSLGFFVNFQIQAILSLLITVPFFWIAERPMQQLLLSDYFALLIVLMAVFLETMADLQLKNFKKIHQGKVCNIGLWKYSRHPNYFCEWLVWIGFFLLAIPAHYGWASIISPFTLYLIFSQITIPLTEKSSLQSRGQAYLDYMACTPQFFPKFK